MQADLLNAMVAAAAGVLVVDGEDVIYQPAGGAGRTIRAVVGRGGEGLEDSPRRVSQRLTLHVLNSATLGIAASGIARTDTVTVARNVGETPVALRVVDWPRQDDTWLTVEVE